MASFPLACFKGEPTNCLLVYRGDKLARQGSRLAFFYSGAIATIGLAERKARLVVRS